MAIKNILRSTGSALRLGAILVAMAGMGSILVSCGGGGVAPVQSTNTAPVINPGAPDLYELTPVTITVTGGKAPFRVFSANASVVPAPAGAVNNVFTLTSNPVQADTTIKITVQDSSNPIQSIDFNVNVHASQLNNSITVTPTTGGQSCGSSVCSGGTATITTTSSRNGVVQRDKAVKFDVVSGDFQFVTPGTNVLANSITVQTDQQGVATAVIRASVAAQTQTGIFQATFVETGQFRRGNIPIQQIVNSTQIVIIPSVITWQGAYNTGCVSGGLSTHYIFGGLPPYSITTTSPQAVSFVTINPKITPNPAPPPTNLTDFTVETKEGGGVRVTVTGNICTASGAGTIMIVRDANGGVATFTVNNQVGTTAPPNTTPPPVVTLDPPTLNPSNPGPVDCGASVTSFINQTIPSGYTGTAPVFTATPLEPLRFSASVSSNGGYNIFQLTRLASGPGGPGTGTVVRISNGQSFLDAVVSVTPTANGNACATSTTNNNPLATGTSLNVSGNVGVTVPQPITGGTGPYTVTSQAPGIVQVSLDGVAYATTQSLSSTAFPFFFRGVAPGVTFITVTDSSTPTAQTLVFVVTIN